MARYGSFLYGTATYGLQPRTAYSVNPMSLTVLDFGKTYLEWQTPTGDFNRIRLVRSQSGYPETAEDGIIIWEENATEGNVTRADFIDPDDGTSLTEIDSGKQIYYRMFLLVDAGYWVVAGQISDVIPSNHNIQNKMMDLIPRVFTSNIQSPIGVVDTTSVLYSFIDGISFTYEQLLTQTDLARPNHSADKTPEALIPIETLNVGLDYEPNIPIKNQKKLVREAIYLYNNKGTRSGLETYVESLTGYAPVITVSNNLMLTAQDSTFYNSKGNWQEWFACTLTPTTSQVPVAIIESTDTQWTGRVDTTDTAAGIRLGYEDPIKKGIPIKENTDYTFRLSVKSPPSSGNVNFQLNFFDRRGVEIGSSVGLQSIAANNTWQTLVRSYTSPADAAYLSLTVLFVGSASGEYYVDQISVTEGEDLGVSFSEAREINIFLNPNKSNYIKNPSFEGTTAQWSIASTSDTTDSDVPLEILSGSESLLVDLTTGLTLETTTGTIPVTEKYFTLSFYAKATDTLTDAMTITLTPRDNAVDITSAEVTDTVTLTTAWQRFSVTTYVDAEDVATSLDFVVTVEVDSASGEDAYFDNFQLEASPTATDPFDGNLSSKFGVVWEGTANESTSHMYYGKALKVPRLSKTLKDWVPPNSFWRIVTYDGLEYTNLSV